MPPSKKPKKQPPQRQAVQPGREHEMEPLSEAKIPYQRGTGKLVEKVALITGGDSGIGRAAAIAFAREGADVVIVYLAFTRSLALSLVEKGIRVNGVAPGPIWTPLIPSTFPEEKVETFGQQTPMKRAGQPSEVATCFVFLASEDSSYMTGQVLHPNGGEIING